MTITLDILIAIAGPIATIGILGFHQGIINQKVKDLCRRMNVLETKLEAYNRDSD